MEAEVSKVSGDFRRYGRLAGLGVKSGVLDPSGLPEAAGDARQMLF